MLRNIEFVLMDQVFSSNQKQRDHALRRESTFSDIEKSDAVP